MTLRLTYIVITVYCDILGITLYLRYNILIQTFWVRVSEGWYDRLGVRALGTEQLPHTELLKGVPGSAHIYT